MNWTPTPTPTPTLTQTSLPSFSATAPPPSSPSAAPARRLSYEQELAFEKYVAGHNVCLTGPGGTGKTALIRHIVAHAKANRTRMQVCALTGCAAVLLECKARTVHSWAGIGLGNGPVEEVVARALKRRRVCEAWRAVDVLVVDEVSMMSRKLFELLNALGRATRRNHRQAFGGIQLIFSGDFYQLPPVGSHAEPATGQFCFESAEWPGAFQPQNHVELVTIFRQTDPTYSAILNQVREGRVKKSSYELLLKHVRRDVPADVMPPTKLFPTRNMVERINRDKMRQLGGEEFFFHMRNRQDLPMTELEASQRRAMPNLQDIIDREHLFIRSGLRCEDALGLKVGAQVMCTANLTLPNGVFVHNGARGVVVGVRPEFGNRPVVRFDEEDVLMPFHIWASESVPGVGVSQIPLTLAWAVTIHKSQGMTLSAAELDVGSDIFECGQTYVAMSRITSMDGLYLTEFDVSKIKVNRRVQDFYRSLSTVFQAQRDAARAAANRPPATPPATPPTIPPAIPPATPPPATPPATPPTDTPPTDTRSVCIPSATPHAHQSMHFAPARDGAPLVVKAPPARSASPLENPFSVFACPP